MTPLMAGENSPMFHDFLGLSEIDERNNDPIVPEVVPTSRNDKGHDEAEGEASTKLTSLNTGELDISSGTVNAGGSVPFIFPASSDPDSGHFSWKKISLQHPGNKCAFYKGENDGPAGKKRDNSDVRYSQQDAIQTNAEILASHSMKVSRLEGQDGKKGRHQVAGTDDFHFIMQPPRPSSKGPTIPASTMLKADLSNSKSKRWDSFGQVALNTRILRQGQNNYAGVQSEKVPGKCLMENTILTSQIPLPPADEGSRTGLKFSNMSGVLNNGSATHSRGSVHALQCSGSSNLLSHGTGTRYQALDRTNRQLTIFYGGHAHVFDDVEPDKAEAILALAGSCGRSWSTAYSCRNQGNIASSASETSTPVAEREGEKILSKDSSINGFSGLARSSEMHIAQFTPMKTGSGCNPTVNTGSLKANPTCLSQLPSDIHLTTERRESIVMHTLANVDGAHEEAYK